jgi:hypothetical protein
VGDFGDQGERILDQFPARLHRRMLIVLDHIV